MSDGMPGDGMGVTATSQRAAEVLREYAAMIEESEIHQSGPLKGKCAPAVQEEINEYRALADQLSAAAGERPIEPDGYAVLLDDPNGATPAACGYWYVGAYRTEVVAKGVAERNKGARVMPMYFTPQSAPRARLNVCVECGQLETPASNLCPREDCPNVADGRGKGR